MGCWEVEGGEGLREQCEGDAALLMGKGGQRGLVA